MSAIVLDTETTGVTEPRPVEIAWKRLIGIDNLDSEESFLERYNPGKPIELGALATHSILDEDVAGCAPYTDFRLPEADYLIGHNVDYDYDVCLACGPQPQFKRICTLALCRSLWPQADSHRLGAMFYQVHPDNRRYVRDMLAHAHHAMADVRICISVLACIIEVLGVHSFEDLWQRSELARIPSVMPFGKHKGMAVKDLPADYKAWLLRQADIDPYLVKALKC